MPGAIWTGTVSFGLVQVPVRVVTATRSKDVQFRQLDEGSGARIRYPKVSEATGEEVPTDQIVKGYELAPGQFVVVTSEELESVAPKATRTIEIEDFVDLADIDPIYFDQPYYLQPDRGGTKAYQLLVDAMAQLGKVAIGRVVLRSKERLVAIRPLHGLLCLETMRYADEVLPVEGLGPEEDAAFSDRERQMARELVESLSGPFEPERYHDEFREAVLELIDAKAAGRELGTTAEPEESAQIIDLTAALERSLRRTRGQDADAGPEEASDGGAESEEDGARGRPSSRSRTPARSRRTPAKKQASAKRTAGAKKRGAEKSPAKRRSSSQPAKKKAPAKRARRSA